MALKVLSKSVANAKKLIASGKVNDGTWAFSGEDGNKLLGENGDDWASYALWHLAEDTGAEENTKARYKYPYGKGGDVYKKALAAAESRASAQEDTAVAASAKELFDLTDRPKDSADDDPLDPEQLGEGMSDPEMAELRAVCQEVAGGHVDPSAIELRLPDDEQTDTDKADPAKHAVRALAKVRSANKSRYQSGEDDGFDMLDGTKVTRATFQKKVGGMPESWKKKNSENNTEPLEGQKKPEPGTAKTGSLPDSQDEATGSAGELETEKKPGTVGSLGSAAGDSGKDGFKADGVTHVRRFDRVTSTDWMTKTFQRTPEGYLIGRAIVTNVGVFNYQDAAGGVRRELRLPEEVFAPESIESLKMKPLTNDHPPTDVNALNVRELGVGHTGSNPGDDTQFRTWEGYTEQEDLTDGLHLPIDLVVEEEKAIQDVLNGKTALSCGYTCDVEPADPGASYLGQPYDFIQRNIRYNHVAIVDRARAGSAAQIRLDSADAILIGETPREDGTVITKITIDGREYQVEKAVADAMLAARKDAEDKASEKSKAEAERDTLKANLEQAADPKRVDEAVKARIRVLDAAKTAGVEVKDGQPDVDTMKAVILKVFPNAELKDKDEAYISARFDGAVEQLQNRNDAAVRGIIAGGAMVAGGRVIAANSNGAQAGARVVEDKIVLSSVKNDEVEHADLDNLKMLSQSKREQMIERMKLDSRKGNYGVTLSTAHDAMALARADGIGA